MSSRTAWSVRAGAGPDVEIHLAARPARLDAEFTAQAESAYQALGRELAARGVAARDLVWEKLFVSDIAAQAAAALQTRRAFHAASGAGAAVPAGTLIQQPPTRPGQLFELQALAIPGGGAGGRGIARLPPGVSGTVVRSRGGAIRIYLSNLTGGVPGDNLPFAIQAASMFQRAETLLARERLSFQEVVRTWLYLPDIDRDYATLNRERRAFLGARAVQPAPASTGVQGTPYPGDRLCGLDLVALGGTRRPGVRPIHSPIMNEAPSYGSDFSRGMRIDFDDRAVIYLSGTASIDAEGQVAHVGDIGRQADRMLANVESLLAGQRAGLRHLVSAVTYLKRPVDRPTLVAALRRRGLSDDLPHTICHAAICRPDWLCEMEAVAILT
jgi:enamine deaminase RidA (YjgF/YER057c/UK114 family)